MSYDEDDYNYLLNSAFRLLSFRPRSRREVESFLNEKSQKKKIPISSSVVQYVIKRLEELDYINDAKFIEWWISARSGTKPKGAKIIYNELLKKGFDREYISSHLSKTSQDNLNPQSQKALARKAVSSKMQIFKKLPVLKRKQKIFNFLYLRGFDKDIIMSIIDEILLKD